MVPRVSKINAVPCSHYELRETLLIKRLDFAFIRPAKNLGKADLKAIKELMLVADKIMRENRRGSKR